MRQQNTGTATIIDNFSLEWAFVKAGEICGFLNHIQVILLYVPHVCHAPLFLNKIGDTINSRKLFLLKDMRVNGISLMNPCGTCYQWRLIGSL